jgi:hypothetical protein
VDAQRAGELVRLAEPLVQQLHEMRLQLMSDAVGRVDEIDERLDISLSLLELSRRMEANRLSSAAIRSLCSSR